MSVDSGLFTDEADRRLIDGILNELIPANADAGVPAAGDHGIADYLVHIAAQDSGITAALTELMARAKAAITGNTFDSIQAADRTRIVQRLEKQHPELFASLVRHTYMGYYSRADIRPLFGLSSEPTQPKGYEVPIEPPEELASLTRFVKSRGRCYRDC